VGGKIKAITFDLWDTIVHDDSDEPKRKAQGLRSKKAERRHLLWAALDAEAPIDPAAVTLAYDVADAAFNKTWHDCHVTWTIGERLQVALKGLKRELPAAALAELVRRHEEMEVEIRPDLIPGIAEALASLHGRYKTCIVSDAIVSPARCLKQLLESYGLARHFDGFAFSDEVGHSKPHRAMFESAARQMGVAIEEMVHIGDRDHNDVKGPQALGMKAILFTATRAADKATTSADAICERHADLPDIVDRLAGG
jgi:putative hydrolase of the HAD superfamily